MVVGECSRHSFVLQNKRAKPKRVFFFVKIMVNIDDRLIHQLNEDELFLLLKIAVRMRTYRMNAWPSTEKIAEDCGWDERKVKRVRNGLVISGHLGVQFRSGKSNVYTFKCNIGLYYGMQDVQIEEIQAENAPSTKIEPPTKNVPPTPYQKCTPKILTNLKKLTKMKILTK